MSFQLNTFHFRIVEKTDKSVKSDTKIARFECLTGLVQYQLTEEISLIDFIEGESVALLIERGLFCQIGALSIPQTQKKPKMKKLS